MDKRNSKEKQNVKQLFRLADISNYDLDDLFLDQALGINEPSIEERLDTNQLNERLGQEQFTYEGTPYGMIRDFLHWVSPTRNDIIYDFGSGYGRVVFYGALTTPAKYVGIEIVPERIQNCQEIVERLEVKNAEFFHGNILGHDFSDGTIFFLFNPFSANTLKRVVDRLKTTANDHPIKIASWGGPSDRLLAAQHWLTELRPQNQSFKYYKLRFFSSIN